MLPPRTSGGAFRSPPAVAGSAGSIGKALGSGAKPAGSGGVPFPLCGLPPTPDIEPCDETDDIELIDDDWVCDTDTDTEPAGVLVSVGVPATAGAALPSAVLDGIGTGCEPAAPAPVGADPALGVLGGRPRSIVNRGSGSSALSVK